MKLKGDQSTSRALNRRLILNCLRKEGELSRVELADMTRLSGAAVTGVTGELIEEGIIFTVGRVLRPGKSAFRWKAPRHRWRPKSA